jgi:hypothetical protein
MLMLRLPAIACVCVVLTFSVLCGSTIARCAISGGIIPALIDTEFDSLRNRDVHRDARVLSEFPLTPYGSRVLPGPPGAERGVRSTRAEKPEPGMIHRWLLRLVGSPKNGATAPHRKSRREERLAALRRERLDDHRLPTAMPDPFALGMVERSANCLPRRCSNERGPNRRDRGQRLIRSRPKPPATRCSAAARKR